MEKDGLFGTAGGLSTAGMHFASPTRRALIGSGLAVAASALTGCGSGERPEHRLRVGMNIAPSHPLHIRLKEASDRIYRASQGKVLLELYPAGQLGSDVDMLSQVRSGAIHFLALSGVIASLLAPQAALSGIGFAFGDNQTLFAATDGPVGAVIRNSFAEHNLFAFPHAFENGFRQITTGTRAIKTPADLRGVKLRVPVGAAFSTLVQALGALPTAINYSELYTALQTHVADGQENSLYIINLSKLYEVQSYCALTSHMWDGFWMLSASNTFARLQLDTRDLISTEFRKAALLQRQDLAVASATLPAKLSQEGMQIVEPDRAQFRAQLAAAGYYRHWREKLGEDAWRTLEDAVGGLGR